MSTATASKPVFLYGPQQPNPNLAACLDIIETKSSLVSITAGWEEWEGDIEWLRTHLNRDITDLELHARAERIFSKDDEFFTAHRARQNRVTILQRLYKNQLAHIMASVGELQKTTAPDDLLCTALQSAIRMARFLDRNHLSQIRKINAEFSRRYSIEDHPALGQERNEILKLIEAADGVLIAGGNVAVLVNRLRLFDLEAPIRSRFVIAWSAGAMVSCSRIVLFHDFPPQGAADPEVLDAGLGLVNGLVSLPHARSRLRLTDNERMAVFAQRFAPDRCLALDKGSYAMIDNGEIVKTKSVSVLDKDGALVRI